ncbi:MAG: hypothetical protein WBA74_25035 [Cyclobacteriaceae bacterium]
MESIESLLDKYWKGTTTLEEEALIKEHFAKESATNPGVTVEGAYFQEISSRRKVVYTGKIPGAKISFSRRWMSLAATIMIGICAGIITLQQEKVNDPYLVEDPEKALEIMRSTFSMISDNLDEGKKYSSEINKINKTQQILETN